MGAKEQYEARKAAQRARQEKRDQAAEIAADKKRWWFKQREPIDRFTGWLVTWTALLFTATVASTVVLLVTDHTLQSQVQIASRQLETMRSQLEEMKATAIQTEKTLLAFQKMADANYQTAEMNQRMAAANQVMANATERAAQISLENGQKQLRSYVTMEGMEIKEAAGEFPKIWAEVQVRNVGLTPASNMTIVSLTFPQKFPLKDGHLPVSFGTSQTPSILLSDFTADTPITVLGPGGATTIRSAPNAPVTAAEIEEMKAGEDLRLMTVGIIHYTDVFGMKHYTRFCQIAYVEYGDFAGSKFCREHNDTN